ncbi:MAG: hypothetical protein HN337_10195, partial [Deltaproteobacteria bacterium]|nr:hypothetical protein [Deltaproteobacteria bacterium]
MSSILGNTPAATLAPAAFAIQPGQISSVLDLPLTEVLTNTIPIAPTGGNWTIPPQGVGIAGGSDVIATSVPDGSFTGTTWDGPNLITSRARFIHAALTGLPEGSTELEGKWARIIGPKKLNGAFQTVPIFRQWAAMPKGDALKSTVTRDGFDMVTAYHAITSVLEYLVGRGHNMEAILGSRRPVVANVNGVPDTNAWMDPNRSGGIDLTFGRSIDSPGGEWHLASDKEIVWHELGHLILHCINATLTSWYARDGGGIHEGFGDALACLFSLDPQAAEDFALAIASVFGTERGLRTVANNIQYKDAGREVHDLGRVYGAFWWSTMKALAPLFGNNERAAADLTTEILIEHGFHYSTNKPGPKDF